MVDWPGILNKYIPMQLLIVHKQANTVYIVII